MIAVRTAPAIIPRTGFENIVRIPVNSGTFASGLTAPLIVSIPVIKIAKPIMMVPASFFFSFLENMIKQTPMSARTGENDVGFNSCTKKFPLSIPVRLKSQDVTVVPMFAPMMTPAACESRMMPELTKPTTITVVADADDEHVIATACADEKIKRQMEGMQLVKTIVVKNKLVNLILKPAK